ncbi:MAG: 2-C-methyl-D-erythritol 4-phosphate cytidylyltransferase, partial [Spirochaetales bacterium]|nr:2-C-methyl-D-erythritol 4-phosphate cytidylyltransferase [Spirochaetales bacterium]
MHLEALKAAVIITAAGSSRRMGTGGKKEFLKINNQSVLMMSIKPFIESRLFFDYVIVLPIEEMEEGSNLLSPLFEFGNFSFVPGGLTRQESVYRGLLDLKKKTPNIVLIHDGARPWITETVIREVYQKTVQTGAAIPVVPSVNAMKTINSQGTIISNLKREFTVAAQTPQGFLFDKILTSHETASSDGLEYIDDAEIYSK